MGFTPFFLGVIYTLGIFRLNCTIIHYKATKFIYKSIILKFIKTGRHLTQNMYKFILIFFLIKKDLYFFMYNTHDVV